MRFSPEVDQRESAFLSAASASYSYEEQPMALLEVDNLVKHFPVRGGLLNRVIKQRACG